MKRISPSYDSRKEWQMDPKGYFLIKVFYKESKLGVRHHSPEHVPEAELYGTDSYEIVQTLVREGLVTTHQHAAYLGHELMKAETALRLGLEYIQDAPLDYKKRFMKDPSENIGREV